MPTGYKSVLGCENVPITSFALIRGGSTRAVWDDERGDDSVGDEGHQGDHCVGGLREGRDLVVEVVDVSSLCCRNWEPS